jgi:hypothetical protein
MYRSDGIRIVNIITSSGNFDAMYNAMYKCQLQNAPPPTQTCNTALPGSHLFEHFTIDHALRHAFDHGGVQGQIITAGDDMFHAVGHF